MVHRFKTIIAQAFDEIYQGTTQEEGNIKVYHMNIL